jgi:tetratricopeptide (TPR) repeat protein
MRLDGRQESPRRRFLAVVAVAVLVPAAGVRAADASWLDLESRIQYAYFTEDARALRSLMDPLPSGEQHDGLKSYYAGLLAYRLILLATTDKPPANGKLPMDGNKGEARQMTDRCIADLDHALEVQSDFPDALALQSACLGLVADLGALRAPFAGPKSRMQIHKALQLAPKNPRVLLLDAIGDYEHTNVLGSDGERTLGKFKKAVAAFEAERADLDQVPGWGAAEAYVWLARCYLNRGDAVAARDALERAILIAPEFAQARRLLTRITSG